MLFAVLHSRFESFLDITPIGRLMNRFSKDVEEIDHKIYSTFAEVIRLNCCAAILLLGICYTVGWEILVLISIWMIYSHACQLRVIAPRREFGRLNSVTNSPLLTSLTDSIEGLPVMKNTGQGLLVWMQQKFINHASSIINLNIYDEIFVNWFDLRMILSQSLLIQSGSFLLIAFYFENLTVSKFGLFLLCILDLGSYLGESIKIRTEMTVAMIAIERCSFIASLEPEANYKTLKSEKRQFMKGGVGRMRRMIKYQLEFKREQVVSEGKLEFQNVSA